MWPLRGLTLLAGRPHIITSLCRMATSSEAAVQKVLSSRCHIDVLGSRISYLDTQDRNDKAVIFLHGNPTSSYLWRRIIPHVQHQARCLAPDLIGMGHSDKLSDPAKYRFVNHYEYLCGWMEKMNLPERVVIVCHDWGSGLGFHWCNKHRDRVHGIVHMESVTGAVPSWDSFPDIARNIFQALRSPAGEDMVLQKNMFVTRLLFGSIIRELTEEEKNEYLLPYREPGESRRPTLTWPREIPIKTDGPDDVVAIATAYNKWLAGSSDVPKLFINAEPGFFSPALMKGIKNWPNQRIVTVKGLHFVQEDSPDEIGQAISSFLNEIYNPHSNL